MIFIATACIILSSYVQPRNSALNVSLSKPVAKPKGKTFKVQSLPFDLNGLHLQYQYTVKEDMDSANPKEMVLVLDKKLVDLKRNVVVLDFPIEQEDLNPTINLSDIDKVKYSPADFEDVNFDGYSDIMEFCGICGGARHSYDDIYLFNPHTKKFEPWTSITGWDVEVNQLNKTTTSYYNEDEGQFHYQEFKFNGHGTELYEKDISCAIFNKKKHTYKVTYNKYVDKKPVIHKIRIISVKEDSTYSDIVDEITK